MMQIRQRQFLKRRFLWTGLLATGLTTWVVGCGDSSEPVADATPAPTSAGPTAPVTASPGGGGDSSSSDSSGSDGSGAGESSSGGPPSGGASSSGGPSGGGHGGGADSGGGFTNSGGGGANSGGGPSGGGHGSPGAGMANSGGGMANSGGGLPTPVGMSSPGGGGHGSETGGASSGGSPYGEGYDTGFGSGANSGGMAGMSGMGGTGYTGGMPAPNGGGSNAMGGGAPDFSSLLSGEALNSDSFAQALQGFDTESLQTFPKDYGTQAELAFQQGYEDLSYKLLLAHLALEPDLADQAYGQVKSSRALKRPAWHLRWGMAISLRTDEGFDGEIDPITSETRGTPGGGGGGTSGGSTALGLPGVPPGYPGAGNSAPSGGDIGAGNDVRDIPKVLGLFAEVTGEMFDQRFGNGDYGDVFASLARPVKPAAARAGGGMAGGGAALGPAGFGPAGMSSGGPGGEAGVDSGPGAAGMSSGPGGLSGIGAGYPGMGPASGGGQEGGMPPGYPNMPDGYPGMEGGMPGGMNQGRPRGGNAISELNALPKKHPQWRPGMVYLGQLSYQDAVARANDSGLDFLLLFDVKVTERREEVENTTRVRVINVANPDKVMGGSKKLSNTEVKNRNSNGKAEPRDMVVDVLKPLFDAIDREVKLAPFPRLTAEQARSRVGQLLSSNISEVRLLAEVQLYRSQGLLTDDDVLVASELVWGDDGLRLMAGSDSVQREAANDIQRRLTAYAEIGMADPNGGAGAGPAGPGGFGGAAGAFGGSGMGGNPGGGNMPNAPSLAPGFGDANSGGANSGGGGAGVSPPMLDL
ncbi:hypothetical protein SH139x_002437 [Planctomycetaceae bacterium SH139]